MLARFVLFWIAAGAAFGQSSALFSQIDEMLMSLSAITGWKVQRKVPAETLGRDKFRQFVESSMKKGEASQEVRAEELALKMFGLVPDDFNLVQQTTDLYSEQAAAFYDYKKKRLFILDTKDPDENEQRMALVHELAHALADQQYPLGKFMHKGPDDDDATTARQAVTEGQATWLSWAYLAQRNGGKAEVPELLIDKLADQTGATGDDFPVFSKAPLYIRESLVFPYTEGLRFQDSVYRERGQAAFDEVFRRPPLSTQQILHAKEYLAGTRPTSPKLAKIEDTAGGEAHRLRSLLEGNLGEFDISALLRQFNNQREGSVAASHYRGGSFHLYEHKTAKYPVLAHVTQWDSPEAAHTFFFLYQKVLRGKWTKLNISSSSETEVEGQGDSGRFVLRLNGDTVQAVEGLR